MQDDLQRLELEATDSERPASDSLHPHQIPRLPGLPAPSEEQGYSNHNSVSAAAHDTANITAYKDTESGRQRLEDMDGDAPSFSPFPKVTGDNIPPADDTKESILWNARKHVLHSQNVEMQISWARDVLTWIEISMDAATREPSDKARPATPRIEHELRLDALNIIDYLAEQEHPDALYIRSKWLEFGKFGHRIDKRDAYSGYKRAADLGNARSEYRMGMLFEQSNDMSKAKEHYYRGMSHKDSAALYRMGMMSLLGQHGETKDYAVGLERIRAAADSSDEDAPQGAYVYGMLVGRDLPDINVPEGLLPYNMDTARLYVEKAAYLGFAKAQLKMGQAYELCQLSCEFNASYSLHYYGLAAKQGLPEAALGVSRWFLFGYEGVFKKNEELAFKYAQEAASARLPTGEFAMGYYYEIGIHVNKSIPDARKWYQMAADHGNKDAIGRLESLSQDQSLSKTDHETTTLTRIKSQHGSQRGKRPERFKQPQQMPTLSEDTAHPRASSATPSPRISPLPSPGYRPDASAEQGDLPDLSRLSLAASDRPPAFNIRMDGGNAQPVGRPQSAAPYPEDDRPAPLNVSRPHSAAPYPDDENRFPSVPQHKPQNLYAGLGPQADRPNSAFGIKPQAGPPGSRPMPASSSTGSLQPQAAAGPAAARGRVASAGWALQGNAGAYRQPSPGPPPRPPGAEDVYGMPGGAAPYPSQGPPGASKLQKMPRQGLPAGPGMGPQPVRDFSPRTSSRPVLETQQQQPRPDSRVASQNYERFSRVPGAGRPERLSSLPVQDPHGPPRLQSSPAPSSFNSPRPDSGPLPGGRHGSATAPSSQQQAPGRPLEHASTAPSKPSKGPATFEDMGIPHGKQDGDCVSGILRLQYIVISLERAY